jgi:hypothetical protein
MWCRANKKAAGKIPRPREKKERGLLAHAPGTGSAEPSHGDDYDDVHHLGLYVHRHYVKRFNQLVNIE